MANYWNDTGVPAAAGARRDPWAGEISLPVQGSGRIPGPAQMPAVRQSAPPPAAGSQTGGETPPVPGSTLEMGSGLPAEVIENPTTMNEAYMGSLKALLNRNKGAYVVAAFLLGTQNETTWEGILYDVGNDYVTIYQEGRDRYIVCDIYSLKYLEFYDTRRRELCNQLLQEQEALG